MESSARRATITLYHGKESVQVMLIAGSTYKYRVKWVQHKELQKGPITSFSIGVKMKNSNEYVNYSFTVYENLDIQNDDSVQIVTIDSINPNPKNGKVYFNVTGTVIVVPNEKTAPEPTQDYSQEPYQEPVQDENNEFILPFDL